MYAALFDNLIGRSQSLCVVRRALAIRRQGNGNFAVTLHSLYADGARGQSDVVQNAKSLDDARAYAAQQAFDLGVGRVVVLSCALA